MKTPRSIFDPISDAELVVLQAFATRPLQNIKVDPDVDPKVVKELRDRGFLQKTKIGTIVTPDGLAALLGEGLEIDETDP